MADYAGGTFGCFEDIQICLYGTFCFACQNGLNHAKIREEECNPCHCLLLTHPYWIRKAVLKKNGLPTDNDVNDCLCSCFCAPCVICQDARALK